MSADKADVGQNRYLAEPGTEQLKFRKEFIRSSLMPHIDKARLGLTLIEGEAEADDFIQARRYYEDALAPAIEKLLQAIDEELAAHG